ncbi:MAG: hypothetical protein A2Y07_11065 [Planctomycetes bacterium GWF2_50_10]|nr:MAG: hypothetical protein A2Y07_11065 [Planctomycetes bacterium GWF2_50_10]
MEQPKPFVSVIVPCRNEGDFIARCVCSILVCDYPKDRFEVIVVDGMSTDDTRFEISQLQKSHPNLKLYDNPERIVPTAMNIGISNSKGEVIIRVDGHAEVPPNFIAQNISKLQAHPEAWCVGGAIDSISDTYVGKAIAVAMSSRFGVGNAMFRLGNYEGYVDTIAFGAYHRWVFDKIGTFDEELVRNQDDELNYRLIKEGGKILMSPSIHSKYYTRTSLSKLWRQYFQYGFWRIRTMQKHRRPATLRQMVPLLLVLSMLSLLIGGAFFRPVLLLLMSEIFLYLLLLVAGIVDVSRKAGVSYGLLSPIVFIILHFGYGFGSLWGIMRFILLKGKGMPKASAHKLSR